MHSSGTIVTSTHREYFKRARDGVDPLLRRIEKADIDEPEVVLRTLASQPFKPLPSLLGAASVRAKGVAQHGQSFRNSVRHTFCNRRRTLSGTRTRQRCMNAYVDTLQCNLFLTRVAHRLAGEL